MTEESNIPSKMNIKRIIRISIVSVLVVGTLSLAYFGFKSSSKITILEEELEFVSLLAYQLWQDKDDMKSKLRFLENRPQVMQGGGPAKAIDPDDKKGPPESSKRKLFIMRMKLMNFQLRFDRFPESVQELKEVVDEVPVEDRSESNVVHLKKNNQGGWIYDPNSGSLEINSYEK